MTNATNANIVQPTRFAKQPKALKPAKAKAAKVSRHKSRQINIFNGIRTALTGVNVGVIAVSLNDIAMCAMHYGSVATWQGYALAFGVDLSYIGLEFAALFAPSSTMRDAIHRWTRYAVPVIAAMSAMANMTQFAHGKTDAFDIAIACLMGAFLPGVAYVNNRILAIMYDR